MVCEGIRVSFYKHEYMVLRLVDQVKVRLRVRSTLLTKSFRGKSGDTMNLPQFDGHFEKEYTIDLKGVSNEKEAGIFTGV